MRKLTEEPRLRLGQVRLFLDDVRDLGNLISDVTGSKLSIRAAGYEFDTVDEMKALGGSVVRDLRLSAASDEPPSVVSVKIDRSGPSVYVDIQDQQLATVGLRQQVAETLRSRERRFLGFVMKHGSWVAMLASTVCFWVMFEAGSEWKEGAFLGWLLGLTVAILLTLQRFRGFSLVVPDFRENRQGFLRRNRDQLLLSLFSAVVGSGLTLVVQWLVAE